MIAATGLVVPNNDCLIGAYKLLTGFDRRRNSLWVSGDSLLPVFGVAPDSLIYAMKVFPANGEFATGDAVLARWTAPYPEKNFLAGEPSVRFQAAARKRSYVYDSLNIQVVNMSLAVLLSRRP